MLPIRVRFSLTSTKIKRTALFRDGESEPTRTLAGESDLEAGVSLAHFSGENLHEAAYSAYEFEISASEVGSFFVFDDNLGSVTFSLRIGPARFARLWNELLSRPAARLVVHIDTVAHAENGELRWARIKDRDVILAFQSPYPDLSFHEIDKVEFSVIDDLTPVFDRGH